MLGPGSPEDHTSPPIISPSPSCMEYVDHPIPIGVTPSGGGQIIIVPGTPGHVSRSRSRSSHRRYRGRSPFYDDPYYRRRHHRRSYSPEYYSRHGYDRRQSRSYSPERHYRSHDDNNEPTSDNDSKSNHSPENNEASGSDDQQSLFDVLAINPTVHNAIIAGDLHAAEDLLTQGIDADDYNHELYANRSVVRARNSEWDSALQDAVKSIAIQPSSLGYISKGIALCGNEQLWDAMEAFDLSFVSRDRDPISVDVLLSIKAVALFNANRHDEAMRRVQDLAAAYQHSDTLLCSVVNSYLSVQLAIIAFEDGWYSEAADQLNDIIPSITNLCSLRTLFEPRLKIFMVLFGWDLDSLWQNANQRRCDALLHVDQVVEAKDSNLRLKGDAAATAGNYETAIELYSTAIALDPSCHSLFTHHSRAKLAQNLYSEALQDAEMVVELNPSSYVGYELKYAALHGAQHYDEAAKAFKIMLLKLDNSPDAQIWNLRQHYVSLSEVEDAVQRAVDAHLENAPLRLLNTFTGRLCDRQALMHTFKASTEYKELLFSSMKHPHLQTELVDEAVKMYFPWVMLSHRWESKEPLLHDIHEKIVYDLDPVGTMTKLQTFCKISRDAGHRWAWSDTCCIDQTNNVELQRSVNSMFVWYRQSALTIVYLSDVPPSAKSGALANSAWNTRGWTVQEFLAPNVVLFYQKDWTLYLKNHSLNHKESTSIMQELEDSTGIDARALVAFRPGMTNAREKLQWASTRVTTLQEDVAYSLFGIFGVHLPVIYGETKQNALGRLLQEIIAQSGDITALDWVGKSSQFNSYRIQTSVLSLRNADIVDLASTLYAQLDSMNTPRFANRRLRLPCVAFSVTELRRRRGQDQEKFFTYEVKADGLDDLLITTEDKLIRFSPARPTLQTFLIIRPWKRHDLGLPDFADDAQNVDNWSEPESPLDRSPDGYPGENEPVGSESHSRALRLIVRLGQPFGALLLAQQRSGEYKRIASDHNVVARIKDTTSVHDMMDVRTLEIL
ncbi:hypothetical protein DFH29DRAFT_1025833 [Suillus ampliporus]|nr:hypothetical protein DFH29DRAFT_1025833 [Suillus ampliporus]